MTMLDTLQPRLRQLKLSGMLDSIAARGEEARTAALDPLEFLALLLDDELTRRQSQSIARRIQRARFEDGCDLRDFDFAFNPRIPKARIWDLAAGRYLLSMSRDVKLPMGLGARHSAAASITAEAKCVAITVSQTTGSVRVFREGEIVLELRQRLRRV